MATLGTLDWGTCTQVSQIIGLLQAPSRTCMYHGLQGGREVCLKLIPRVTPLNTGELVV